MRKIEHVKWFFKQARFWFGAMRRWGRYPRAFIFDDEKRLVYLNNPKVACSSIKRSMFGEYGDIHTYVRQKNEVNDLSTDREKYYKFTFVRNPYKRLVSCFEDKCMQNHEVEIWDYYIFGSLFKIHDFNKFIRRICLVPHCLAEAHFAGQYRLIYDKSEKCFVDFVGKIENIKEEYEPIRERFDLLPLAHYNRVASLTGKNWMDYYTLFTAELIYWKYKKDFVAFGYEEEYKKLKAYLKSKKKYYS